MINLSMDVLLQLGLAFAKHTNKEVYEALSLSSCFPNQFQGYDEKHKVLLHAEEVTNEEQSKVTEFLTEQLRYLFDHAQSRYQGTNQKDLEISWRSHDNSRYGTQPQKVRELKGNQNNARYYGNNRVFVSHSTEDKKLAGQIGEYLEILGFDCFVAHDSITGGSHWPTEINKQLVEMNLFVAVLTENFSGSTYCHQECGFACSRAGLGNQQNSTSSEVKIIPLWFGGEAPEAMMQSIQAARANEGEPGRYLTEILKATGNENILFH